MFCTGVFILSMSGFGPIVDNAGGIVEVFINLINFKLIYYNYKQMSGQPENVRNLIDRLDAVGNVINNIYYIYLLVN